MVGVGPAKRVVNVPRSIDPTGRTDVTGPLQQFLVSVPNGSTVVFPSTARYRIEGTLTLIRRDHMTITGGTFFATTRGDRERSQWMVRDSDYMTLRNMHIIGASHVAGTGDSAYQAPVEAQHAFDLQGVQHLAIVDSTATDVYGDFVYIGRGVETKRWSDNVVVANNHFARNGRMGVSVVAGSNILVRGNTISDTRRSVFDLEPNASSGGASNVTIDGNTILKGRLNFVSAGKTASTRTNDVHDIAITNNVLRGHIMNIFVATRDSKGQRRANFSVVGNRSDHDSMSPSIRFTNVDGVYVAGNVQPTKHDQAVTTSACTRVVVKNNRFALN